MWEVYEHRRLAKILPKLPLEVLRRYEKWKDVVRVSGPAGLRDIRGFRDESLKGERRGQRSSRLNQQYRVIYEIEADEVLVYVLELTPHDYRRK